MERTEFFSKLYEHYENGDLCTVCVKYPSGTIYVSGVLSEFECDDGGLFLSVDQFMLRNDCYDSVKHADTIDGDTYEFTFGLDEVDITFM